MLLIRRVLAILVAVAILACGSDTTAQYIQVYAGSGSGARKSGYVITGEGDSLMGANTGTPTPPTMLNNMLLPSGLPGITAFSHSSYTIAPVAGCGSPGDLTSVAPSEVDPLVVHSKTNIHWLYELTNSLACYLGVGSTPSQAISSTLSDLTVYIAARKAAGYNVIHVSSVMPRSNTGVVASFESTRVQLNFQLRSGAGAGGYVVVDIGADPRIGVQSANMGGFYFLSDFVHTTDNGNAIVASYEMTTIRATTGRSYIPLHAPYWMTVLDAATGCKNASGSPCANGDSVVTWANQSPYSTGDWTQTPYSAASASFVTSGIGGLPAMSFGTTSGLAGPTNSSYIGGTIAFVANVSTGGYWARLYNSGGANYSFFDLWEGAASGAYIPEIALNYDGNGGLSQWTVPVGGLHFGAPHVYVFVGDGTNAGSSMYIDGVQQGISTYASNAGNPGLTHAEAGQLFVGATSVVLPSAVGQLGAIYASPVPLLPAEVAQLTTYLRAQRGF